MAFARVALVMAAAAVLGMVGCSDGGGNGPVVTGPVTTSSSVSSGDVSPSPSASATVPPLPAAASKPTARGAEAFFRHFWNVYNYAYANLDAAPLQKLSYSRCVFCRSAGRHVSEARKNGQRYQGGEIRVTTAVAAAEDDPTKGLIVNAVIDQQEGSTLNKDGSVADVTGAVKGRRVDALVRWEDHGWIMYEVEVLKEG